MEKQVEVIQQKPLTPGIGVAGVVMCPLFKGACLKGGCEWFVELNCGGNLVARCSMAWLSVLSTETRASIDKLKEVKIEHIKDSPDVPPK